MSELETSRLYLRGWKDEDYEPFYRMSMDPRVMEFLPAFQDKKACDSFFNHMRESLSEQGWGFWAMERKEDGVFMGIIGMHKPGPEFGVGEECVEMGWRLAPEFWGNGYVTEAAREILRFGFEELDFPEIVSFTALGNTRSLAVMARLGMERDDRVFDLLVFPEDSPHRPHCISRLSREKWREKFRG
ncbi:GNAT family N-acetyltransferase [Desulfococcaceae bacterium OttesenSCG-928-F15]|nr:GNAT family N-acetyltransferase [Desulfococcaceae bacterium OttesenSCG-928-F15]